MVVALFWSMMNMFYYTSSVGLSSTIRSELTASIFEAERARMVFDQERKYAIDRALLFTGLIGGNASDDCGAFNVAESFPFIPVPTIYDQTPTIKYWKNGDQKCIPDEATVIDATNAILRDYFSFAKVSSLAMEGELSSRLEITLNRQGTDDVFTGELEQPYLRDKYDIRMYRVDEVIGEQTVTFWTFDFTGETYSLTETAKIGESVGIENINFDLIELRPVNIILDDRPYPNPMAGKDGLGDPIFYNKATCHEFDGNFYLFASNRSSETGLYEVYVFDDGATCYYEEEYDYWPVEDDFIDKIVFEDFSDEAEIDFNGLNYQVSGLDYADQGAYLLLQPYSYRTLVMGKDWVHYSPQMNNYDFPQDVKIGELTTDTGEITYTFIPTQDEKLCFTINSSKYEIQNCVNLLSKSTYSGSFTDLYSYAKEYVSGEYGDYEGWQNYELDHRIDYTLDSLTMRTVKVMANPGEVIALPCEGFCESGTCVREPLNCPSSFIRYEGGNYYCTETGYGSCTTESACLSGYDCVSDMCVDPTPDTYNTYGPTWCTSTCPGYTYECFEGNPICYTSGPEGPILCGGLPSPCATGYDISCSGDTIICTQDSSIAPSCAAGETLIANCQCSVPPNCGDDLLDGCQCYPEITALCPSGYTFDTDDYKCKMTDTCELGLSDQTQGRVAMNDDCECYVTGDEPIALPKQDWKSRLIWNLGLEGTDYSYADHECAKMYLGGDSEEDGGIELFNCLMCPGMCNTLAEEAVKAEFKREFEQVSPIKLQYYTSFPWAVKVKDFTVKVTDKCSGESITSEYDQDYDFQGIDKSQVIGLPLQFLFAYQDSIEIESPYDGCPCQDLQKVGSLCFDELCDCLGNSLGPQACNPVGYCCPTNKIIEIDIDDDGIYGETLEDGTDEQKLAVFDQAIMTDDTSYPCCTLFEYTENGEMYKCYEYDTTALVNIEIPSELDQEYSSGTLYVSGGGGGGGGNGGSIEVTME